MTVLDQLNRALEESRKPLIRLSSELEKKKDLQDSDLYALAVTYLELKDIYKSVEYLDRLDSQAREEEMRSASVALRTYVESVYGFALKFQRARAGGGELSDYRPPLGGP